MRAVDWKRGGPNGRGRRDTQKPGGRMPGFSGEIEEATSSSRWSSWRGLSSPWSSCRPSYQPSLTLLYGVTRFPRGSSTSRFLGCPGDLLSHRRASPIFYVTLWESCCQGGLRANFGRLQKNPSFAVQISSAVFARTVLARIFMSMVISSIVVCVRSMRNAERR